MSSVRNSLITSAESP